MHPLPSFCSSKKSNSPTHNINKILFTNKFIQGTTEGSGSFKPRWGKLVGQSATNSLHKLSVHPLHPLPSGNNKSMFLSLSYDNVSQVSGSFKSIGLTDAHSLHARPHTAELLPCHQGRHPCVAYETAERFRLLAYLALDICASINDFCLRVRAALRKETSRCPRCPKADPSQRQTSSLANRPGPS